MTVFSYQVLWENSLPPTSGFERLIVIYKDSQLPAKIILRLAYCLANNIPSDTKLKFSSGEARVWTHNLIQ
jgi:hypothetical protein